MISERLQRCRDEGMSILVGTVDAAGTPACCRGIAIAPNEDFSSITVYVPAATSHEVMANVATTRRIAVVASQPIDHATVQFKGTTHNVRLASAQEAPFVRERLEKFAEILETIGVPRRRTRSMTHWPAFAIEVSIREVFEQTPGPNAGSALP